MSTESSLWARSRQAAFAEITSVAMRLFLENGFEQTTIDEIASTAGISRRSFFRYFGTKEDIVLGDLANQGALVRDALEAVPLTVGPWDALSDAMNAVGALEVDPGATLKISKMMYNTPSLRSRRIEKHLQWQSLLVPNIRLRLGTEADDPQDPAADAIVATAIACLDVAGEIWTRGNGITDLAALYEKSLRAVRDR
ncbi:TetR/AcrR family transcriptional regulator [Subtercola endophyticus]|uniref:TetR/AcrR family transcriptional regulator n=1 Tax=Subtercola endophyticus TaxID=2895559 RepID=UPI001E474443|nr:TetR/AcrR family transcriptional regulator [Subtercola endophyticus]UFS59538.1 TetR/AcrR family transcriptional regulator [Subtercola endophyticus]